MNKVERLRLAANVTIAIRNARPRRIRTFSGKEITSVELAKALADKQNVLGGVQSGFCRGCGIALKKSKTGFCLPCSLKSRKKPVVGCSDCGVPLNYTAQSVARNSGKKLRCRKCWKINGFSPEFKSRLRVGVEKTRNKTDHTKRSAAISETFKKKKETAEKKDDVVFVETCLRAEIGAGTRRVCVSAV